jgi:peptide alpha-N-acetyltransferase
MQVRRANMHDIIEMQHCNLRCLPENYNLRYYFYHYMSWPHLLHVLEDINGTVAGYVLAKLDDEEDPKKIHGHITSLAVLRTHRRLGAAGTLMNNSMRQMRGVDDATMCSLHVRRTNAAALHLYQDTLSFRCAGVESAYYVDQEDAFHMKRLFKMPAAPTSEKVSYVTPSGELKHTKLEPEELAKLNGTIEMPKFYAALQAAPAAKEHHHHNHGAGCGCGPAPAKKEEAKKADESKADSKGKKAAAAAAPAKSVDVDAQLAAIEGDSKGGKGKGKKK